MPVRVLLSIDTEEDNWVPARADVTVDNIAEVPAFHRLVRDVGFRPTYFVTHSVTTTEWAADLLAEIASDGATELGSHLHPWNTPPVTEPLMPRHTMTLNLPAEAQRNKLEVLTSRHSERFGRPRSFRAGRFGLGPDLVRALIDLEYHVDSSVTPYLDWSEYDDGPDHSGAPIEPYLLGYDAHDVRAPGEAGQLVEMPISVGFTRTPFATWSRIHRTVSSRALRPLRLWGAVARTGLARKVILSPEVSTSDAMIKAARCLLDEGATFVQLFLHSSSLRPGLSPFTQSRHDVDRLIRRIGAVSDALSSWGAVEFLTVGEAAERWRANVPTGV